MRRNAAEKSDSGRSARPTVNHTSSAPSRKAPAKTPIRAMNSAQIPATSLA
jgi:ABC-type uncharacterized transport system involved in gliding motility auxiliary subunit